jgi:Protein of unknown function (DUF1360)
MNYFLFLIVCLAIWRITHLLAKEDGPWDMIYHIRKAAGAGFFGNLLDCFYCLSIWIALLFAIWLGVDWWQKILYWFALSGAACLLEQATTSNHQQHNKSHYTED